MNKEYDVYINGEFVGTVFASSESEARCAAWSTFDPDESAEISVNRRA